MTAKRRPPDNQLALIDIEPAPPIKMESRRESLMDAYDILGVSPDDPIDLIKDVFRRKSMYYHPDKGGTDEKFKRLNKAYELIMQTRGA